jgi:rieske iron-sulfur protein
MTDRQEHHDEELVAIAPRSTYPTQPEDWKPGVYFAHEEQRMANRRRFLKYAIGIGTGAFALALALPALAIRTLTQQTSEPAPGDVLVYAQGNSAGAPVHVSDVPPLTGIHVWPEGKSDNNNNLIELVRVSESGDADGFVAYSAICTHLGCSVYDQLNAQGLIVCPCHVSRFDPANDAAVVGGPASRPLPRLPVTVNDNGEIVVDGTFDGPVGAA